MDTLRDLDLVRAIDDRTACEFRAADPESDILGELDVRFSPFNKWYRIASWFEGDFMERTVKGAFKKTIAENVQNMRVQFDHGMDPSIGSKVLGGITSLEEKSAGPLGIVELDDTSYNRDLLPGLKRGRYGSSFRFRVIRDEWNDEPGKSEHNPDGVPERTIKEVRLMEFGPVTWPANPAATAGVRSATDLYYEALKAKDPKTYDDMRSSAIALRERTGAAAGTPDPATAAPEDTTEPARTTPRIPLSERRKRALQIRGVIQ
jgi:HK97 family phage prohead protease